LLLWPRHVICAHAGFKVGEFGQYLMAKRYIFFLPILFFALSAHAQVALNYRQYGLGVGASYIRGYTDVNIQNNHFAQYVNFTYYLTAYIPLTAEIQKGTLSGGSLTLDPSGRVYNNNYGALIFHGDYQAGQFIDNDDFFSGLLKNFYLGTGFGLISNNNAVQRTAPTDPNYVFPGQDNSLELMVPIRFGYEIKIMNSFGEPFLRIDLGYVHNVVFGDGLDGYTDPPKSFKNNFPDQFRQISFGIKFDFGKREQ